MNTSQLPRREFLAATAGSLAAFPMTAYALNHSQFQRQSTPNGAIAVKGKFPIKAISSHNGLEATKLAYELMKKGTDTLDAAVLSEAYRVIFFTDDDLVNGLGRLACAHRSHVSDFG